MKKETREKLDRVWEEARKSAEAAVANYDDAPALPCGFAWITVSGRGSFGKYAKEVLGAGKNTQGPGFNIWYFSVYPADTQSMCVHTEACSAAAAVLRKHGISASVRSMMD